MTPIYVYLPKALDFSSHGLGALSPTEALVTEKAGADYELSLKHPMDAEMRWVNLKQGAVIKLLSPARLSPLVSELHEGKYKIYKAINATPLLLRGKADGEILERLSVGEEMVYIKDLPRGFAMVVAQSGLSGAVLKTDIRFEREEVKQTLVSFRPTLPRLFRVFEVIEDSKALEIRVLARAICFDELGNLVKRFNPQGVSAKDALDGMVNDLTNTDHALRYHTRLTTPVSAEWAKKNAVQALGDPESGLAALTGGLLVRDNGDISLIPAQEYGAGITIEHGKNLIGVTARLNTAEVVTRLLPVGRGSDGNDLYLPEMYIDSPMISDYPAPRAQLLNAKGDTHQALRAEAQEMFNRGCDLPEIEIEVDFILLGDTEEYKQYRNLQAVSLHDSLRVRHEGLGLDFKARVLSYVFDALLGRYKSLTIGNVKAGAELGNIAAFQLPNAGIPGMKLVPGSVDTRQIRALAVGSAQIQNAAIELAHIKDAAVKSLNAEALTALKARLGEVVAGQIVTDSLYADIAAISQTQITTAAIGFAQVKDLTAGTAIIREGIGGRLIIDRLQVSEANIVNLQAGSLLLHGEAGGLYRLKIDETGRVVTELRYLGGGEIENHSLDAELKLVEQSITANLLNVGQIFASSALIGAIKAQNIEAQAINASHLNPAVFEAAAQNATGQQLVVEFSNGTILDAEKTATMARVRVYHGGREITAKIPEGLVRWERISGDADGDAAFNADPAHLGRKEVEIRGEDVDFRGVLRCVIDEVRLHSLPVYEEGCLVMRDFGTGDAAFFTMAEGVLYYNGETAYTVSEGRLAVDMVIGAFTLDTTLMNLKTSYMSLTRQGVELYGSGHLKLLSGGIFNLRAGNGNEAIGMSNDEVSGFYQWAGSAEPATAPFSVKRDGTVKATKLKLGMTNMTEITHGWTDGFRDDADTTHPVTVSEYLNSDIVGVKKMMLTFKAEPIRVNAKGVAAGGGATSGAGGAVSRTSRAGGGSTSSLISLSTQTSGVGSTGTANAVNGHRHSVDGHNHVVDAHAHSISSHTHIIDLDNHAHSIPDHVHALQYGIWEGGIASALTVYVDGSLAGAFDAIGAQELDLVPFLIKENGKVTRGVYHTIEIGVNALTRIVGSVYTQVLLGVDENSPIY